MFVLSTNLRIPDNGISVFGGVSSSMGRPTFAGRIQNVTVHVGKEAVLACPVNNIGKYKVRQSAPCRLDILSSSLATMHKGPFINDVY